MLNGKGVSPVQVNKQIEEYTNKILIMKIRYFQMVHNWCVLFNMRGEKKAYNNMIVLCMKTESCNTTMTQQEITGESCNQQIQETVQSSKK